MFTSQLRAWLTTRMIPRGCGNHLRAFADRCIRRYATRNRPPIAASQQSATMLQRAVPLDHTTY